MKELTKHQKQIFQNIRVLDFTRVLAGPYCTRMMADMGAEVIKVEIPITGDEGRKFPYLFSSNDTGYYLQQNCGKKSISLDMQRKEAIEIIKKLACSCDVVVENFRPGVMEKYHINYVNLKNYKKDLIMCSISAFGQTGPYSSFVGNNLVIQAMCGLMDMTGSPDGPPFEVGTGVADTIAGTHAFGAIGAALYRREQTGEGEYIDISMMDCMFSQFDTEVQSYILSGGKIKPTRWGNHHPTIQPLGMYQAKDGWLIIGALNNNMWDRLIRVMKKPELIDNRSYINNAARVENKEAVIKIIQDWVRAITVDDAVSILRKAHLPTAPVLSIPEVVNHPQIRFREMLVPVGHRKTGTVNVVNCPIKYRYAEARVSGEAAFIGEHNHEVLENIGYTTEDINLFRSNGVLYEDYGNKNSG